MSRLSRALQTSSLRNTSCALKGSVLAPPRTQIASSSTAASTTATTDSPLAAHLNSVFSPLQFPPELARRILTHGSHPEAIHGHNGRLAFIGARLLPLCHSCF
ncbi:hypothetical protein EDD17DRAFT_1193438 [Pisolithus thermaeus]|nr:hypothetical protein EDD17DRAFT_1193438 [Pisolithus thermaeus]